MAELGFEHVTPGSAVRCPIDCTMESGIFLHDYINTQGKQKMPCVLFQDWLVWDDVNSVTQPKLGGKNMPLGYFFSSPIFVQNIFIIKINKYLDWGLTPLNF